MVGRDTRTVVHTAAVKTEQTRRLWDAVGITVKPFLKMAISHYLMPMNLFGPL